MYKRYESPEEAEAQGKIGRVEIDGFYLQIDNDYPAPHYRAGRPYVTAYFYTPVETPDGKDPKTGIIVSTVNDMRFAEVPVSILNRAKPVVGEFNRTLRLLHGYMHQAEANRNSPGPEV